MNVSGECSSLSAPGMSGSLHPVERPEKASFWIGQPDAKEKEGKGEARPTVIFHKVPLRPFGCRNCDNFRRLQHLHMKDLHGSQALIIPAPATRADSQNICLRELRVRSPIRMRVSPRLYHFVLPGLFGTEISITYSR